MHPKQSGKPAAPLLFLVCAVIIGLWAALPAAAVENAGASPPVLVVDPGHGGLDGGATAADGSLESAINLAIALRVRALARLFGVQVRLTRDGEGLDYPPEAETVHAKKVWDQKRRVALIRQTEGAMLLSIHQNKYPDARPRGSQVLYARTPDSAAWAELTHVNLIAALCPDNRRVAAPISEDIYLMREIDCPGILVECGFLSNPQEAQKLKSPGYQLELALVLTASYLQFLSTQFQGDTG